MGGFLEGTGNQSARGFLEGTQPATANQDQSIDLDSILASEGAERVKPVLSAIIGQESGGNPKIGNSVDGAHGIAQVIPATFSRFAKPGERIDNPADNLRVAARYANFLYDRSGGDPAKIAAGYFSGEGNIGTDAPYKVDRKDGNGKTVSGYVADVMARMAPAPQAGNAPQTAQNAPQAPTWAEMMERPQFKQMTPAERDLGRAEYFNRYIAPTLDESQIDEAKALFIEKSKAMEPKEPGVLDSIGSALSGVREGIREFAGTTEEQQRIAKLKRMGLDAGVMTKYAKETDTPRGQNPKQLQAIADLPATDEFKQKVRDEWAAGTPEQREGMLTAGGYRSFIAKQLQSLYGEHRILTSAEQQGESRIEATDFDFDAYKAFNDPKSILSNPLVRGAVKGYDGYKMGVLGLNQFALDAVGADGLSATQAAMAKTARGHTEAMGESKNFIQRNFEGAISSTAQQLPALLGGAVTGSEALVLGSMFTQVFGQEYSDGRSQGLGGTDAAKRAAIFGSFEIIGEKFGMRFQLDALRQAARGVPTGLLSGWMENTIKREVPGEFLTTTGQFLTDKAPGIGLRQDATLGDYAEQMADTFVQTIMQSGVMAGATHGAAHAVKASQDAGKVFTADDARDAALNKWRNDGLSTKGRVEPTMDAYAAGLPPEQRAVDQQARDAFADLTTPALLDDEIPASMVLGKEAAEPAAPAPEAVDPTADYVKAGGIDPFAADQPAAPTLSIGDAEQAPALTERRPTALADVPTLTDIITPGDQTPAGAPEIPTLTDIIEQEAKGEPAPEKKTKLTPFTHPHLGDVEVRGELAYMAEQAGWAQVGGKMIREDATDQSSAVTGRTPWIPKQQWYGMMPERLNEEATIEAVGKALLGQPMTAKEKRVIGNMLDWAKSSLDEQKKWSDQIHDQVGATSAAEYETIAGHADQLENDLDGDIPFDVNDSRLKQLNTDKEIDEAFGIKQDGRVSEDPAAGNAAEGNSGAGTPAAPKSGAEFQLQGETAAEVKAKEKQTEKTKAAERKAQADLEAKEKADQETKEIKQRATAAADNFQLGENAEDALSGQKDIFAEDGKKDIPSPAEGGKKTNEAAAHTGQIIAQPTKKELYEGAAAVDASPFYHIEGTSKDVVFKPRNDRPSAAGRTRVQGQRHENGKADRWNGTGHLHDFIVRDGKLWALEPNWGHEGGEHTLAAVTLLDAAPNNKPATEKEAAAQKAKAPFAGRIDAMLKELRDHGQDDMAKAIEAGIEADAKNGKLTEETVAFREKKARETIAAKTDAGKPIPYEPMTADKLASITNTATALPKAIIDAAVDRWNEHGPALAKLGFSFGDVNNSHPPAAVDAHRKLADIVGALNGLAPRRYQAAKGHKNLNPDAVTRNEKYASDVLGIDTAQHPGVNTSSQVTLATGVRPKTEKAVKAKKSGIGQRVDGLSASDLRAVANAANLNESHLSDSELRDVIKGRPEAETVRALDTVANRTDGAKQMDDYLSAIEGAIAEKVSNAGLVPNIKGHPVKGSAMREKTAFEAALRRAGWTYDKNGDDWAKNGSSLFLRSQGDTGSVIAQWQAKGGAMPGLKPKNEKQAKAKKAAAPAAPAAQDEDLDAMFDELMAERTAPAKPAKPAKPKTEKAAKAAKTKKAAKPVERTAGEAAVSAAKNSATGFANAIDALGALFGAGPGTLGSGPVFNEETYAKAKPLFQAAVDNFTDAAADIRDVMRAVIAAFSDKFGNEITANMKPYIVRFVADYREGNNDAPTTSNATEQDGADHANEAAQRDNPVHGRPAGAGPTDSGNVRKAEGKRNGPIGDRTVHDSGAPADRAVSGNAVSEPTGEFRLVRDDSAADDAAGSGPDRAERSAADEAGSVQATPEHVGTPHVSNELTFEQKVAAQKAAESVKVVYADRDNIDATLPLLYEGQREDVHFAEQRLAKPDGTGVLFTNGTGTGKTFLGLGIVKRMVKAGKTNGIVVVPNQDVMNEWLDSAPSLGLSLHQLKDKQDAGKGVSITTYANFGDNYTLLDRNHHFVVADEAHKLMANADATDTVALDVVRAITMHKDSAYQRAQMLHRELRAKINALHEKSSALAAKAGAFPTPAQGVAMKAIADKLIPLEKQWREKLDEQRALVKATAPADRPRLIALSATPFAYEKNVQWAEGYLFNYPVVKEVGSYGVPSAYQKFMIQNFGYQWKNRKLNEPDAKVDRALMQIQFHEHLKKTGVLSARRLDSNRDYDRKFILVDGGIGARIDDALAWLRDADDGIYRKFYNKIDEQFDYLTKKRLLEAIKAKAAIDIIKQHHALGRKVVVFHDYNQGGGFQPFSFDGDRNEVIEAEIGSGGSTRTVQYTRGDFIDKFAKEFPELVGNDLAELKSPIETLREAFPQALFNNGKEKKSAAAKSVKTFRDDANPDANLLVVQSDKNEGWSAHDTSGKHMRVALNLGLPTQPAKSIQLEGRIYRWGQMSDAAMRYMNTGTRFERNAFATSIATRAEAVENLGMGQYARGLKKSFIEAFLNSDVYTPGEEDGKGGKEADRRESAMNEFDRAKALYWAQEKKTARNKAAEGADYFATPEPLGFKMVQWLQTKAGESLLEPSGGHGAIARWFPEDSNYKVIEPSMELASRLSLAVDPQSVINEDFESHYIGNKYDGIAMNPPFGTAGKLAMEHVAKAFGHLREGGRIVAIIPNGPAMDKRLNDWLTATNTNAKGEVSTANPDVKFVTYVSLPASTFSRAGTGVMTRVVIIDRVKGANDGTGLPHEPASTRAGRNDYKIDELFDYIKDMDVPARTEPVAAAPVAPTSVSEAGVTVHPHGRVVDDASKATFRVVGNKLETDAPIEKVQTKNNLLEGVYVKDRAMATAVDPATWIPLGKKEYFVRIKHVVRPQGDTPTMFSKSAGNDAAGAALNAGAGAAVTKADADNFLNRILAKAGGAIPGVRFEVVESMAGLPADIIADATDAKTGEVATVNGAYKRGVVWLVLDTHKSAEDLEQTVFHEIYGHVGIQKLYGSGITRQLSELYQRIGKSAAINAMAEKYGINLSAYWKTVGSVSDNPDVQRRVMMEELLAHIAEQGPSIRQTLREILGGLRAGLRSMGFMKLASVSAADLAHILRQARAAVPNAGMLRPSTENGAPQTVFRLAGQQATVKPKFGLLDTPMRLAMQHSGAMAVWRGAFRLLEKTAGFALNTKLGEVIKAGLIDRYGLSDAIIDRNEEMRVNMIAGVRQAETFLTQLSGLSRAEYAVLYAAANNADLDAVNEMIKDLPAQSQATLHEIKALVRDLGQQAVDLHMLDADTFKANEMAYLHRSYLKYEAELVDGEKAGRALRIKGDQFKQRGLADIVPAEKLLKWMPDFWGTRVKNGAITAGTIGQQFIRFERRDDPTPTANLPGIDGAPALGKLKEVVYWPAGEETPDKFGDWHREGEWTVRRTVGTSVVFRRDFTKEERERMGEIDDIRYGMAKTLHLAIHDVEAGKYFGWIAENHAKLPGELPAGAEVIEDPRRAESKLQSFTKDVWVKVPETKVTGTGVHAYGKLAGRYIPGPVWADIRAVNSAPFFNSSVGKLYEKLLRMWKISKTALSPAVHVNNVMANVVMADWHDVSGPQLLRAAHAWAGQHKNPESKQLVRDFQDNGGELGAYALTEMQRSQLAPLLEELLGTTRADNDLNGIINASQVISLLREGMVRQAAAAFGQSKAARGAAAIPAKMIDVYQTEDQIFRLAAFIKARESGLTDREAGRYARKSFLDYNIQAPWVVAAKNSGVLPFISFSYRAIPMLYQTLRDKPWKVMKLALVLGAMSAASAAFLGLSPDDEEKERRWLPDEKAGTIWGMVPKMVRMPWNTASDNPVFLDVRRFIPAGDITDTGTSHGALPLPGFMSVGGPLAIMVEMMSNKSMFTGKEIVKDTDDAGESVRKLLDYTYKWAAPNIPLPSLGTIVPGGEAGQFQTYSWTGISNAYHRKEGTFGRDQSVPMAIGSGFGIKLEGYNPAVGQRNAQVQRDLALKDLASQQRGVGKQYAQGGISSDEMQRKTAAIQKKKADMQKKFGERATSKPKPGLSDLYRNP